MSRRSEFPQSRHHILVFDEDWDFLRRRYGPGGANPIGINEAIRTMIHERVRYIRMLEEQKTVSD